MSASARLACKAVIKCFLVTLIPLDGGPLEGRDGISFHSEALLPIQDQVGTKQCSVMLELAVWTSKRALSSGRETFLEVTQTSKTP